MGWWSKDVLGGDTPLDCLCAIESLLGVTDLYPLSTLTNEQRIQVKKGIAREGYAALLTAVHGGDSDDPIGTQVVAVVAMAAGAQLTPEFKAAAITAGEQDEWALEDAERGAEMADYIVTVERYTGSPVVLAHTGLFAHIAAQLSDS